VRDRVDEFKESFAIFVAHRETVASSDARANGASSKSSAMPRLAGLTGLLNSSELVHQALLNRQRQTK
jgi:hypothetical protein